MKYTIEQIKQGDDELILRYQCLNQEVEHIMNFMSFADKKLVGTKDGSQIVVDVKQILYIESVDRKTFVFLEDDVVRSFWSFVMLAWWRFVVVFFTEWQIGCNGIIQL